MPVNFKVEYRGFESLKKALMDYPQIAVPATERFLRDSGNILLRRSQSLPTAALPQKSGALRKSFSVYVDGSTMLFYTQIPYARYVHEGTRPHDIFPKGKKALAFNWTKRGYTTAASGRKYYKTQNFGNVVFRSVHHPGTKAVPFMETILSVSSPEIIKRCEKSLEEINQEIARRV